MSGSAPRALQEVWETIPFTGGVSKKLRQELVPKGKLLDLQNLSFNADGTLKRRDAMTALSGAGGLSALSTQAEMLSYGNELLTIDNSNSLFSYSPSATKTVNQGNVSPFSLRKDAITRSTGNQFYVDTATNGNLTAFVWTGLTVGLAAQGIFCSIIDETSGLLLVNNLQLSSSATANLPRVAFATAVANAFVFVWVDGTNVKCATINAGATTVTVSAFNVNTAFNAAGFTIDLVAIGAFVALAFSTTAANQCIAIQILNGDGSTAGGPVSLIATGTIAQGSELSLGMSAFSSTLLAVVVGTAQSVVCASESVTAGSPATNPTTVTAGVTDNAVSVTVAALTSTTAQVFSGNERSGAGGVVKKISTFVYNSNTTVGAVTRPVPVAYSDSSALVGPLVATKAFAFKGIGYVGVAITGSTLQNSFFVIDRSGNVVARALYGTNSFLDTTAATLRGVSSPAAGVFSIALTEQNSFAFQGNIKITQSGVSRIKLTGNRTTATTDFRTTPLWHSQLARNAYFTGASPQMYDGARVAEAGFLLFPEAAVAATSAGRVGPAAGAYQYVATYEWVDNQGNRHQSAPSAPFQYGTAAMPSDGHIVNLFAQSLFLGTRAPLCNVVWWRTQNAGNVYFRVNPASLGTTPNNMAATSTTTTDALSDASLGANEALYTQPLQSAFPVLPNDAPAALQAVVSWQGRLVASLAEDRYSFVISQVEVPGVGLQWNETLVYRIPRGYGEIVALGVSDDKLIIFTPTRKFFMSGSGPDPTGQNASFTSPQLLPADVGCVDQRSVVLIPDVEAPTGTIQGGLGFQSRHGYYMLNRALVENYIGSDAESDVLGHTISSAAVLEDKSQLRLVLSDVGNELVYDFLWGQWSRFTGGANRAAGCVWNGLWTVAEQSLNEIVQENLGTWIDVSSPSIVSTAQTAWLELDKFAGFQRIWRAVFLGSLNGHPAGSQPDSSVTVTVDFDYQRNGPKTYSFTVSSTNAISNTGGLVEFRHHMQNQKCQAVSFTIVDTPNITVGGAAGTNWTGMKLQLGVKKGTPKLPAAQSF